MEQLENHTYVQRFNHHSRLGAIVDHQDCHQACEFASQHLYVPSDIMLTIKLNIGLNVKKTKGYKGI